MTISFLALLSALRSCLKSRAYLQAENLALGQQIMVLQRGRKRLRLNSADRIFWVWLSRHWADWSLVLAIVKPETVIGLHRKGFRLYWSWKSRRVAIGRRLIPREVRDLIRKMSSANPLWGTPRIHGELLELGINPSQATVAKYMGRQRKPPSQS
jgi:putative transposase